LGSPATEAEDFFPNYARCHLGTWLVGIATPLLYTQASPYRLGLARALTHYLVTVALDVVDWS